MIVVIAGLMACASGGAKQKPADTTATETTRETWYVVRIDGSPVGFARETLSRGPSGAGAGQYMNLTLSRMGQELNMLMSGEIKDGPDGRLLSGKVTVKASVMSAVTTAVLEGDTLTHTAESAGFEHTRYIPWEEGAVGPATADILAEEKLRAGETDISIRTFEIDSGDFKTLHIKVLKTETLEIDGRDQRSVVVEEYEDDSDVVMSTVWLDESYTPYKSVMNQMGLEIVVERIDPDEMDQLELEPDFDIIRQSMIPCVGYPEDHAAVENITMRLNFEKSPPADRDFEGPNQTEKGRGEDYIDLVLTRSTVNRIPLTDEEHKENKYLEPDRYIQSTHPEIMAVADSIHQASGAEGWKLAQELAAWVNAYITGKNFGQGFASALEVLKTQSGDCTEHSVLLSAVLRASGIPARPAVGLAYSGGQFVGHMWTEAYVDYWRTLDALDLNTNPIRIRVSAAAGDRAVDEKELVRAYSVVGGLSVEVMEYNSADYR